MATARAYTLARIHDSAITMRQRLADTSTALRLALTDPAEVRVIAHDTSLSIRAAIPTGGPWLPLAAGSGSPLTANLYGTGLNFATTADAPISITHNLAGGFTHPFQAFNSGMVTGNQYNFDFGQSASTNNAANFGFKYVGANSTANYVTLGMYGANDLMTITAAGVPKFSGLATTGFVRANASGQLSSSALVYADITSKPTTLAGYGITDGVRSVGLTAPALMTASGSPVTGTGTLALAWNGSSANLVRADGSTVVQSTFATTASLGNYLPLAGGVMSAGATITVGGLLLGEYPLDGNFFAAYGDGAGTPGSSNPSIVVARNGQSSSINGSINSSLSVGGSQKVRASSTGAEVLGTLSVSGATTLATSLTGILKANAGTVSAATAPDFPTLNQSTTGNAATATLAANSSALGGVGSDYFVQGNGAGPYGHRTTNVTSFNTLLPSGFYDNINGISPLTTSWTHMIRSSHTDPSSTSTTWSFDLAANFYTAGSGNEGYYVRINEGSNWGTWRTLWHSGNLSGSANVVPKFVSASSVGSSQITDDGTTVGIGGFRLRDLTSNSAYAAIYGSTATASGINFGLVIKKDATEAWISGTTSSNLAVGSAGPIVTATASGAAVTGSLSISALIGTTTRIATVNAAGQIGATENLPAQTAWTPSAAWTLSNSTSDFVYMPTTAYNMTLGTDATGRTFRVVSYPNFSIVVPSGMWLYRNGGGWTNQTVSMPGQSVLLFAQVSATTWYCM